MRTPEPLALEGHGVRLEPLSPDHVDGDGTNTPSLLPTPVAAPM